MLIRTLAVAASVLALTACATPAAAIGSMTDVNVVDRNTGETLPMYWHDGRWWVPGRPGNRYAVSLTNRSGGRTLNVISVDGVNVVSGETAAHDQTGYVLTHGQFAQITGWRKNLARVAAFEFTALPNSYAARTGRPDNVGVIGVAVFRERVRYVPPPAPASPPLSRSKLEAPQDAAREGAAARGQASPSASGDAYAESERSERRDQQANQRLGTGHGRSEYAPTQQVAFERAQSTPDELITIHYDSRENLIAMGAIPRPLARPHRAPEPFPAPVGFVPDPPRRW
ncbi:MAG TPA: hypothetical protein VNA44_02765 [Burkholderiaceae bacterium]|nr:hypothetical protein [Burkholderiaceae bacterium]